MTSSIHTSADVVLVCPHLGDGGMQRVASILASEWAKNGRQVCIITLYDHEDFYELAPQVYRITLDFRAIRPKLRRWRLPDLTKLLRPAARLRALAALAIVKTLALPGLRRLLQAVGQFQTAAASAVRRALAAVRGLFPDWRTPSARKGIWIVSLPLLFRVLHLRRHLRQVACPVIVAFGASTSVMTVLAAMGLGRRVVISERNDPARQILDFPWQDMRQRFFNHATIVTANSHGALHTLQAFVATNKLAYVPNPLISPELDGRSSSPAPVTPPCILNVARLQPQKGHDVLLEAFAQLSAECAQWSLVICGRGPLEEHLRIQASDLGIQDRLTLAGQVADPFVYYRAASMFVLPSLHEGTPNALLEAMSCGLPCIVTDASPGPLELVTDGHTGLVVPAGDPASLVRAMERLASDAEMRAALGKAARQRVAEFHLPNALAVWERVLGWRSPDHAQG